MKDANIKQKSEIKIKNNIKNSSQNNLKPKLYLQENNLITNKLNKKALQKTENENRQIKSKFTNKLELLKDKEIFENKSIKEDNCKKYFPSNSDKKIRQNSIFQDLIVKIIELNNTESSNSSNILLNQKKRALSNSNSFLKPKKISFQSLPQIKNNNTKKDTLKNKNLINSVNKSETQEFRKHSNIKSDSSNSYIFHQNENEYKYNSCVTDNFKAHLKKPDLFLGFNQISGSSSSQQITFRVSSKKNTENFLPTQRSNIKNDNDEIKNSMSKRQKEIAQSILELDLNKLQKEVYDYENTDVTDAINKLPTHKFEPNNNKNNNKNRHIKNHFITKNNNRKNNKKCTKNIKERFRILRRVGYVYDSLDYEEYEDEEDNNFYFEPNGYFILILDFIILIASLFDLIFLPIHLSSSSFNEKNLIKNFIFSFIDIIFIIDFISGFFRAYFNFDEDLIKNSVSIIQHYLRTWFLLDFLCGIPVYSILKALSSKNKFGRYNCYESCYFNYNGRNLFYLFELIKLLKLIKIVNFNIARDKIKIKIIKINFFYNWENFIKQVFNFISILNLSSCLFIFSVRSSYPNWILNLNMDKHNFISIYICSCYYIITTITTVGYGDIQICSMTERIFGILFLIFGTCLYSWLLTFTSNILKN